MGKYTPLIDYFRNEGRSPVSLSFQEIETTIGDTLPQSAYTHSAWWTNSDHPSHPWTIEWLTAGWLRDEVDIPNRHVRFIRLDTENTFSIESPEAIEGYLIDRSILSRTRNKELAEKRRLLDSHTCQACGFVLIVNGRYIIDVHHRNPLATTDDTVTHIEDLVCLCPTCHRIAHTRAPMPFGVDEIKLIRRRQNAA